MKFESSVDFNHLNVEEFMDNDRYQEFVNGDNSDSESSEDS